MDLSQISRKIRNAFGFGITQTLVRAPGNIATVQVRLSNLEVFDLRVVEQRGFASNMPIGTPVTAQFHDGDRSNGVVTGSAAPASRPALNGPEDAAMYGYTFAVTVLADGIHITAPDVFLTGNLHVGGNALVTGEVYAKAGTVAQVGVSTHHHTEHDGPSTSAPAAGS